MLPTPTRIAPFAFFWVPQLYPPQRNTQSHKKGSSDTNCSLIKLPVIPRNVRVEKNISYAMLRVTCLKLRVSGLELFGCESPLDLSTPSLHQLGNYMNFCAISINLGSGRISNWSNRGSLGLTIWIIPTLGPKPYK